MTIELKNYFKVCPTCRYDLRFDYDDQVRICPKCSSKVELSPSGKRYIQETYGKRLKDKIAKELSTSIMV